MQISKFYAKYVKNNKSFFLSFFSVKAAKHFVWKKFSKNKII